MPLRADFGAKADVVQFNFIAVFLLSNLFFDYFLTWKTGILFSKIKQTSGANIAISILDILITVTTIAISWVVIATLTGFPNGNQGISNIWPNITATIEALTYCFQYGLFKYFNINLHNHPTLNETAFLVVSSSILTSCLSSIWFLLFIVSDAVGASLRRLFHRNNWILDMIDFESAPLRTNGLISGSLVISTGTIMNVAGGFLT